MNNTSVVKGEALMTGRANATEINKAPDPVVFMAIAKPIGGNPVGITSYRSLKERIDLGIEWLKMVDLDMGRVIDINPCLYNDFLESWRDNYFNSLWNIPEFYQI